MVTVPGLARTAFFGIGYCDVHCCTELGLVEKRGRKPTDTSVLQDEK